MRGNSGGLVAVERGGVVRSRQVCDSLHSQAPRLSLTIHSRRECCLVVGQFESSRAAISASSSTRSGSMHSPSSSSRRTTSSSVSTTLRTDLRLESGRLLHWDLGVLSGGWNVRSLRNHSSSSDGAPCRSRRRAQDRLVVDARGRVTSCLSEHAPRPPSASYHHQKVGAASRTFTCALHPFNALRATLASRP
jgi:hypothetical protein